MAKSKSVVLIHGNFVNELTWAAWKKRFEDKGYTVYIPVNPGHAGEPAGTKSYDFIKRLARNFLSSK